MADSTTNEASLLSSEIIPISSIKASGGDCGGSTSTSSSNTHTSTTTKAANFSKLLLQEFDFVAESFEAVKRKASQVIAEVQETRNKFEKLILLPEGTQGREPQLEELTKKVHKLKSSIPFNLITPVEKPNPNVNWRPRPNPQHMSEVTLNDLISRTHEQSRRLSSSSSSAVEESSSSVVFNGLSMLQACFLWCFVKFPPEVVLKKSILFRWLNSSAIDFTNIPLAINGMIEKGFVEAVHKKSSGDNVCGYRMNRTTHYTLSNLRWPSTYLEFTDGMCLEHNSDRDDIDIFYTETTSGLQAPHPPRNIGYLNVLHMGKWTKSSSQHIEFVDNPELFFKDVRRLSKLKYISFRGVSMLQELPKFITKLDRLFFLDLQACYNLEVIPTDIANLGNSLRYLDMSECYFLEHMPKALAKLHQLKVLKGFFVGEHDVDDDERTCTVEDLVRLQSLSKLNIYTSVKEFPNRSQLSALQKFQKLRSLTISWGGCKPSSPKDENRELEFNKLPRFRFVEDVVSFPYLDKLDLQCFPKTVIPRWLKACNFRELKRLYIRGGRLHYLGLASERNYWSVQILRLKHLSKLRLSWELLRNSFLVLERLENVNCPNLVGFPCDGDGLWIRL